MAWEDGTKKVDLHRHFGGSISPETIYILLRDQGVDCSQEDITSKMVCRGPQSSFHAFLSRFDVLNSVNWTEEAIERTISQVVYDLNEDGIDYCDMTFSIDKYIASNRRWTRTGIIRFISDIFRECCNRYNIVVQLILSMKMESDRDQQLINASLINNHRVADRLRGIDIVGDERAFDVDFYKDIFRDWRAAGKLVLAHAGETGPDRNVFDAITRLHVHRVRHGIAAAHNPEIIAAARDLGVAFDISLHSNMLAGTTSKMREHHLPILLRHGCVATLGTDDPVIFDCNLQDEYNLAVNFGLLGADPEAAARSMRATAAKLASM